MSSNSYPFVPGQCMLTFVNGTAIVDDEINNDLLSDLSYQLVSKMQDSINTNNLEKFKQMYTEEYISNPDICDFFKFDDENNNWWFNSYSLCCCSNKEDEPDRIHRHMYVRPCNCSNGKRYLAYLSAFNYSHRVELGYCYDTNPKCSKSSKPTSKHATSIQQFLLNDGPIDLTYECLFYKND